MLHLCQRLLFFRNLFYTKYNDMECLKLIIAHFTPDFLLDNYDDCERIKANGLKKALKQYTWDNWAKAIVDNVGEL